MSKRVCVGKIVVFGLFILCSAGIANAALGDLSIGGGSGVMVANDKKSYMGDTSSMYGEFQLAYDIGVFQLGSTLGYYERTTDIYDDSFSWRNRKDRYHHEDVLAYLPLEVSVKIMPFRGGDNASSFQPYIGVGAGGLLAVGDNDDSYAMVSPKIGLEFIFGRRHMVDIEAGYHFIFDDEDGGYSGLKYYQEHPGYDYDLDYYTVTVAYRFKFLFGEHHRNK